ncbi:MAG: thermonuclease family protein [Pseudomonadota bacterium]
MRLRSEPLRAALARLAFMLCVAFLATGAQAAPIEPGQIRVIDGDTIAVGETHYRLVGFDTPETGPRARCSAERALGAEATQRLRRIVAGGGLDLRRVSCRCPAGTEGTRACNYGRLCGTLTAGGRDVGEILIAAGLARLYPFGAQVGPATWCGRNG